MVPQISVKVKSRERVAIEVSEHDVRSLKQVELYVGESCWKIIPEKQI